MIRQQTQRALAVVHGPGQVAGDEACGGALVPGFRKVRRKVHDAGESIDGLLDLAAPHRADAGPEQMIDPGIAGAPPEQPDRLLRLATDMAVGILEQRHQARRVGALAAALEPLDAPQAQFPLQRTLVGRG
ncbi:MAG: hypothetical protein H0T52_00240 [Lautropia sp.]|nr:hypothetical protein [Lautropia sp.]